ncbi:TPA: LamG domain-containing protein [Candidatus Poribacteria bacterium]|nr:LamG domain-containing protein [Candidatus Poribacteria bacterium]
MFHKTVTILFIAVFTATSMSIAQQYVTDGLIGFWTLDQKNIKGDIANDVWGNNHGKIFGAPQTVKGKIGEALEFDGKDDYVQLPDMGNEPEVTVEAWTLAHSMPPQAHACCIGIVSSAPNDQWKAGTVHFKFEAGQITVHKQDSVKIRFMDAKLDEWYHVAYTSSIKKNELTLYVNGELIGKDTAGGTDNNLTHIVIASEHEGRYLPGLVDEVRIYKRILSSDEIERNYQVTTNAPVQVIGKLSLTWGMIKCALER